DGGMATPASAGQRDSKRASPLIVMNVRRSSGSRRRLAGSILPAASTIETPRSPIAGSDASASRRRSIVSGSMRQSGFRNSKASPRASAAPRLQPAPKPKFVPLRSTRSRGSPDQRRSTASIEPSAEALSLTTISTGAVLASTRSIQTPTSSPLSAVTTTTLVRPGCAAFSTLRTRARRSQGAQQLLALLRRVPPERRPLRAEIGHAFELGRQRTCATGRVEIVRPFGETRRRIGEHRPRIGLHDRARVGLPVHGRVGGCFELVLEAIDHVRTHVAQVFAQMLDAFGLARA